MRTFMVFKNGIVPTEDEFINFAANYLGITQWSCNFSPVVEYEDKKPNTAPMLETTMYTEQRLDGYSMDWEFIQVKDEN